MDRFDSFIFESYDYDPTEGRIRLRYSLDGQISFVETLELPQNPLSDIDESTLDRALLALHLAGGMSYYKTFIPKRIEVKSGELSEEQAAFWNEFYEKGLGEFFYKNTVDFRDLVNFPFNDAPSSPLEAAEMADPKRVLIPIGGGKDSMVTVELMKKAGYDATLFRVGSHPLIRTLAEKAGLQLLSVERHLSPELFKLNEQGALNGHVPITGYLSFLSIVISILYGFDAVTFSNEHSSSYGNVEYLGSQINHQWSKSLEFEQMFQAYLQHFVGSPVAYFSPIRPLSELAVTKIFAGYPQYFPLTTSCNSNWRILKEKPNEKWCKTCPKCAFAFAMFAAFFPPETVIKTVGGNLFDDKSLIPLYKELLGLEGFKPFECVGTPEETRAAFLLAGKQAMWKESEAMQMFQKDCLPQIKNPEQLIEKTLKPSGDHAIPGTFAKILALFA